MWSAESAFDWNGREQTTQSHICIKVKSTHIDLVGFCERSLILRLRIIDEKLNFKKNCEALCKKGHQRLYCLRKLSVFNLDRTIMKMFYHAFIESVLSFSTVVWYGHISLKAKNQLDQIVKWSGRLIGESKPGVASLYTKQLQRMAFSILHDDSHPLHSEFQLLPSARRYKVPRCRTKRYKSSFVPNAINMINKM